MPLSQGNVTIKLAGGDYSTWAAFWDDLGNLTGDITCTVDASAFTEAAGVVASLENLNGYTIHVLPAAFPAATDASDGARFTFNTTITCLQPNFVGPGAVIIEGIVFIEGASEPATTISIYFITTSYNLTLRRNIVKGCGRGFVFFDADLENVLVYNNFLYDQSDTSIELGQTLTNVFFANNTIVESNDGIGAGLEAAVFENNLVYGSTRDYYQISNATGNNNAGSDATGEDADWDTGINNVSSIADPFNAIGSDDFTITTSGVVGAAGKDLSGTFTTDFFGVTRINWTIGACEYITTGPAIPVLMANYRRLRG